MAFNSLQFTTFFVVTLAGFWLLPRGVRMWFLVGASLLFYGSWIVRYVPLVLALAGGTYFVGLGIERLPRRRATPLLLLGLAAVLGTLVLYKYADLLLATAGMATHRAFDPLRLALPLGISFFTFEFVHYLVDVYRGAPAVRSPLAFALFALFFPTQIAGPIKRFEQFVPQLDRHRWDAQLFEAGFGLVLRGFFKKLVLADTLAAIADQGFGATASLSGLDAWIVVVAFALQIFFDFSGYTDIGRGAGQMLGFRLPENFHTPYLALGLRDFWRRWHIPLSSWLRDYLYIPLGGSRVAPWRASLNLLITMALGGLWHGASWTFALWGAYHGLLLVAEHHWGERLALTARAVPAWIARPLGVVVTFLLVCVGWVLFRADSLGDAGAILGSMFLPRTLGLTVIQPDQAVTILLVLVGMWAMSARLQPAIAALVPRARRPPGAAAQRVLPGPGGAGVRHGRARYPTVHLLPVLGMLNVLREVPITPSAATRPVRGVRARAWSLRRVPLAVLLTLVLLVGLDNAVFRTGLFERVTGERVGRYAKLADKLDELDTDPGRPDLVVVGNSHAFGLLVAGAWPPRLGRPLDLYELAAGGMAGSNIYALWDAHLRGPHAPRVLVYDLSFWTMQFDLPVSASHAGEETGGLLLPAVVGKRTLLSDVTGILPAARGGYAELQLDTLWRDLSAAYQKRGLARQAVNHWLSRGLGSDAAEPCCSPDEIAGNFQVAGLDDSPLSDAEVAALRDQRPQVAEHVDGFLATLAGAHAAGTDVVLVVMPLRDASVPDRTYLHIARRAAARYGFPLLEVTPTAYHPELFDDWQHVNPAGAREVTALVTAQLWSRLEADFGR